MWLSEEGMEVKWNKMRRQGKWAFSFRFSSFISFYQFDFFSSPFHGRENKYSDHGIWREQRFDSWFDTFKVPFSFISSFPSLLFPVWEGKKRIVNETGYDRRGGVEIQFVSCGQCGNFGKRTNRSRGNTIPLLLIISFMWHQSFLTVWNTTESQSRTSLLPGKVPLKPLRATE